jgi:hypothetical protein
MTGEKMRNEKPRGEGSRRERPRPTPAERAEMRLATFKARQTLALPTILFSIGLALCIFLGLGLDVSPWTVVLWAASAAVILCAVLYNRVSLLVTALLTGIAALVGWLLLTPKEMEALYTLVYDHCAYIGGFLFGSEPFDPAYNTSLFVAIVAACALLSSLLIYRLRSALAATMLAFFVFVVEWGLAGEAVLPALWPTAVACTLVLAVRGFRWTSAAPWQSVAVALVVSLLATGVCVAIVPSNTQNMRLPGVERALDNVGDLLSDYTGFQRPHASFSLSQVGMQPLGDRLGGPVDLPDYEVLRVSSLSSRLLRGSVRNFYTGQSWTRSASVRTYRLGNPFIAERQSAIMGTEIPPLDAPGYEDRFATEIDLGIAHTTNMGYTLFTAGRVRGVESASNKAIENFDENGEVFLKRPIGERISYRVQARVPILHTQALDQVMQVLYEENLLPPTDAQTRERLTFLYSGLPDNFPEWIAELAQEVTADAENDYQKAAMLTAYLRENYAYTLQPAVPPENQDFVEFFLETGEGYCTYFASALATMARTVGLPSRYVEGFLLTGSERTERSYSVKADQAHAWAEIYIGGAGWMSFDPTPRTVEAAPSGGFTMYTPTPTPTPAPPEDAPDIDLTPVAAPLTIPWWAWVAAALVALIVVFFALLARHDRRWDFERLEERYADPQDMLSVLWRDTLDILTLMGGRFKDGDTPRTYALRVDEAIDNPEGKLAPVADALARSRYGGIAPTRNQLDRASLYRAELDYQLRKSVGRVRFLFLRALRKMPGA